MGVSLGLISVFDSLFVFCIPSSLTSNIREMFVHEAIDLIVGGPPCQDFSAVNANRGGVAAENGQYFVRFGTFINSVIKHPQQLGKHVHFFAENVGLKKDDLVVVEEAFDSPLFPLDAQRWSPCKRERIFFSNLPCPEEPIIDEWSLIGAKACLKGNGQWMLPGDIGRDSDHPGVKANTFMASLGRIDDKRMTVVRKISDGRYEPRKFSVEEREHLMGYKAGYVEWPVEELYFQLKPAFLGNKEYNWKEKLPEKFHCFSGEKVKLHGLGWYYTKDEKSEEEYPSPLKPCIALKLAPPQTRGKPTFFHADQYSKHLIGNAYCVPVAVTLLAPLEALFEIVKYKGYPYTYKWGENDDISNHYLKK